MSCHVPKNNSDVIVTYSGHAEANFEPEKYFQNTTLKSIITSTTSQITTNKERIKIFVPEYIINRAMSTTDYPFTEEDDVVFIPNEKAAIPRYGDEFPSRNKMRIEDLMKKSVGDIINDQNIRIESNTEAPKDIFFISGKNNENIETSTKTRKTETKIESRRSGKETLKLDCRNLDCNNTISSVCGGKYEHREWRYRIFLNDCYFRKVNCAFKYPENRYKLVLLEKCKNTGAHVQRPAMIYNPSPPAYVKQAIKLNSTRRNLISRRSETRDIDGQACSHACPITCPEDYEPECAVSSNGNQRVFLNHCKLDYNSCTFGVVWYKRPLSECVGGRKADMRQNRAFIGWMQRVGIVDNKGRLVLS
ncbi:hypothetical protein K1T71_000624 [Dendrolimus kikuchii]|uniref:Uncharacterized protein n=1 Tax=Dendrolimus kikuchii TaxID=765133 RepID=A0ACC1DKX7_9NEOP|nr:hypothetical protein K1T71_000624 [Dendrolimus kikuchii]